ncbi:MAG: DUF5916 domain-containing protein [bacterium]
MASAIGTKTGALWICLLLSAANLGRSWSQSMQGERLASLDGSAEATPVSATARRVDKSPRLDGNVLEDSVWASVRPLTEFWQTTPDEGHPATEQTEVRIIFTADTLYFGVVCYDRSPKQIIVSESRRDSPLDETDCFQIILDTYLDRQNGFVFGTNPAGIEYDGQVSKEGEGSGTGPGSVQVGSGGGFNINWDGSWEVRAQTSDVGWSVEFAVPFRTLRYASGNSQTWGLNFQRNIRRRNETAFWAPLPRQFNLYRLSRAGTLTGIVIPQQRNLKLTPYVLGQGKRVTASSDTDWLSEFGGDLKYSLTPSLTLDLTINTDFAQVEADELQINLDRFNLFYPEKRPFFLENAGLFSVGSPGEVEMFFSRRIGIAPDGTAVPILGGARLSGKIAGANIGLLDMQTDAVHAVTSANNFAVARVNRELPNRSAIGAMLVNRQGTGDLAPDNDYNRTFSADGRLGIGKYGLVSGYAARTATSGVSGDQHAFKLGTSYDSEAWLLQANYTEVGDYFNPEVGFLSRRRPQAGVLDASGYRKPDFLVMHRFRPKNFLSLHELRPHISYRGFWDFQGFQETGFLHIDNHWEWKSGYEFHTGINFTREGLTGSFEIYPDVIVPPGTYDHAEVQLVLITNEGAWWSYETTLTVGGFFGGDRLALLQALRLRYREILNLELGWNRNDIDLPGGDFVTNLARARLSYSFTPRVFLQGLLQYNDRDNLWATNLRLGWLQTANTGLFVVYNETRDTEGDALGPRDRSLIVKYSRLFDLLN